MLCINVRTTSGLEAEDPKPLVGVWPQGAQGCLGWVRLTHHRHGHKRTLFSATNTRSRNLQSIWWNRLRGQERFSVPRHRPNLHGLAPMNEVISSQSKAEELEDQSRNQGKISGEGASYISQWEIPSPGLEPSLLCSPEFLPSDWSFP